MSAIPTMPDNLAELLRSEGWEPDSNVCLCGHLGGDHNLNNICLLCEPFGIDRFGSFSQSALWDRAISRLRASGVVLEGADR